MTNTKVSRKDVPTDEEVLKELETASKIPSLFQRRRAEAIVALLETGKRRSEIATLQKDDLTIEEPYLFARFTVRKKRKKDIHGLQRTKKFLLTSPYAQAILRWLVFINDKAPGNPNLFPRIKNYFGQTIAIHPTEAMKPQAVWRILKKLNPQDWPHLHRERRAVKVIRADEKLFGRATLETVYKIKRRLDLEDESTAYNYINRHETQIVNEADEEAI